MIGLRLKNNLAIQRRPLVSSSFHVREEVVALLILKKSTCLLKRGNFGLEKDHLYDTKLRKFTRLTDTSTSKTDGLDSTHLNTMSILMKTEDPSVKLFAILLHHSGIMMMLIALVTAYPPVNVPTENLQLSNVDTILQPKSFSSWKV